MGNGSERRGREERKLLKKRKPERVASVQYPDRLKEGEDANEDAAAVTGNPGQSVNQSVFSMITRAGSNTDFHKRFDEESSDSDNDAGTGIPPSMSEPGPTRLKMKIESAMPKQGGAASGSSAKLTAKRLTDDPPERTEIPVLQVEDTESDDPMSHSTLLPPIKPEDESLLRKVLTAGNAPVMSQMLEAHADFISSDDRSDSPRAEVSNLEKKEEQTAKKSLSEQLKDIFSFEDPEEVIAGKETSYGTTKTQETDEEKEYPCWLTQSVLLQGYMYITKRHVCFYAYAPKKSVRLPLAQDTSRLLSLYRIRLSNPATYRSVGSRTRNIHDTGLN